MERVTGLKIAPVESSHDFPVLINTRFRYDATVWSYFEYDGLDPNFGDAARATKSGVVP